MLRASREEDGLEGGNESDDHSTDSDDSNDDDDDKVMKVGKQWKRAASKMTTLDKDSMKVIALIALVLLVLVRLNQSTAGTASDKVAAKIHSKKLRTSQEESVIGNKDDEDETATTKKKSKKLIESDDDETHDPTASAGSGSDGNQKGGYLSQGGAFGLMNQPNPYVMSQTNMFPQHQFMQPGLMQQQGMATQQFLLQQQQQQQQAAMMQSQQQQQALMQQQAQKQLEEQLRAQAEAIQKQQQALLEQQQQALLAQQQQSLMPQGQGQFGMLQGLQGLQGMQGLPGADQQGVWQQQASQLLALQQQLQQMQALQGFQQQPGMQLPGMSQLPNTLADQNGLNVQLLGSITSSNAAGLTADANGAASVALPDSVSTASAAVPNTDKANRPTDADMAQVAEQIPLTDLSNFRDSWEPYTKSDVPIYFHIPKSGGSSVKDAIGSCHRMVMASEFGVTDGHDKDTEVAVVYPKVPGGTGSEDRSPFVNVDTTTVAGIERAAKMGFADAGLAGCVITPFLYEANNLFTQTAQGRLFAVFREPVDRAISMFYYLQVADWEPTYRPEMQQWTLKQYAESDAIENNWMTRQLSNTPGGDLDESHLKIAMEVIRRKFLVGLMKQLEKSMTRFEQFFRWKFHVNPTNQETCRARLTGGGSNSNSKNKKEKPKKGEEVWELLAAQNVYDIQLFEYIETLFEEQAAFVEGIDENFRNIDATCCKCDPPTFPPEGFNCPKKVLN